MEENMEAQRCAVFDCPYHSDEPCAAAEYCAGFVPVKEDLYDE
jgi:hypothetical protein